MLAAGIVSAACGSDSDKRTVRASGGGAGGEGGDTPAAAGEANPDPVGGRAGEPGAPAGMGGVGGDAAGAPGAAGMTPLPMGGEPSVGGEGGSGGSLPPIDCTSIVFADMKLESAVRDAIGKPDGEILPADVADLTDLQASGYGVAFLDGIECLPSLSTLNLGVGGAASDIVDLSPLAYLKGLTTFECPSCPITSVAPLGELPQLTMVHLSYAGNGTDPIDLSGLATAPALTSLDLYNTKLGSLSPLAQIKTLDYLNVSWATSSNPNSLGQVTSLTWLEAVGTWPDATPFGKLTKLQELYAGGNTEIPMTNTAAFAPLVDLTLLNLEYAGVTDPSFIQGMTKLTSLSFYANPLTNLNGLAANAGLGTGDSLWLTGVTTLNCTNEAANLKTMTDRGLTIYGSPCP
jgi:hypothetical protein